MGSITYRWSDGEHSREFALVQVDGTRGRPFTFGDPPHCVSVNLEDFFIAVVPVTQALWIHVMGADDNASLHRGADLPVENISWDGLVRSGGFLERMSQSAVAASLLAQVGRRLEFRLPSETEWEYAARGGVHWRDGYRYSGSNEIDAVAWYDRRHGDHTQPVSKKAPNQLGIYDMSGNVWEWCEDVFSRDVSRIPTDGTPARESGDERVLRGGCFHNWALHCTVSKRYQIPRDYHDGCIGFRIVLGEPRST